MMTQNSPNWRDNLVDANPHLFKRVHGDDLIAPGYPDVQDGWRQLVETAVGRIARAVAEQPVGAVFIDQVKSKYGTLRLYYVGKAWLSMSASHRIEEAIALAEARSGCTCEVCGEEGLLFERGDWLVTACEEHGKGRQVAVRPGWENIHIARSLKDGKVRIISCVRYIRETDTFEEVPPFSLGIKDA
jgi:hypothetical protein